MILKTQIPNFGYSPVLNGRSSKSCRTYVCLQFLKTVFYCKKKGKKTNTENSLVLSFLKKKT